MASPLIVTFTQDNFEQEALKSAQPVLDELANEYQGKVKIGKVNVDEHQGLAAQFRVTAIPTLLVIKNGLVAEQMVGAKSKRDLKATLDRATA